MTTAREAFDDPRHRLSEELCHRGDQARHAGHRDEARHLYSQAADAELELARWIGRDGSVPQLRSIFALSAVHLLLRADRVAEAFTAIVEFLREPTLMVPDAVEELRHLALHARAREQDLSGTLLRERIWKHKYDSDERSLIEQFYVPALRCAVSYDRSTGFFSSRVLTLAARGVEGLVRNDGRMRLVVGCTLQPEEVVAIETGLALRDAVKASIAAAPLDPPSTLERDALELLAWMIARGFLDVRVAVPCDANRKPIGGIDGIFHEKAGIITDKVGDRLAFNGSVNETLHGWGGTRIGNWESFHVFTDWSGGVMHVDAERESFDRLWSDLAKHCLVIDVREAIDADLLRFLPPSDAKPRRLMVDAPPSLPLPIDMSFEMPPKEALPVVIRREVPATAEHPAQIAAEAPRSEDDLRRRVWQTITFGPALSDGGERVGEATSAIVPWPHQVRAFHRAYDNWPPKLLIADEVGLGKTIEAGLILRQAWLSGRAKRILVLAPRAVLTQWQIELREKFNLDWPIYDGQSFRWYPSRARGGPVEEKASRAEWHRQPFVLASSQLMRRADRAKDLLEDAAPWDLVVLDEAHHARRRGAGSATKDRGPNQLLRLMQGLKERTKGLLLLTATPMQVDPIEVWDLLALLGLPPKWTGQAFLDFFAHVGKSDPSYEEFERLAELFRDAETTLGPMRTEDVLRFVGNSKLAAKKVLSALRDKAQNPRRQLETDRRRAALAIMRAGSPVGRLVSRHTRELLRRYHAAGKLDSRIADRQVSDEFVALSPAEREVYDAVQEYISTTYDRASDKERNAVGFVMTIYRRRLASSFAALEQTLAARLEAVKTSAAEASDEDLPDDEATDEALDRDEAAQLVKDSLLVEETTQIGNLLTAIRKLPTDTKATKLLERLEGLRASGYTQAIVFTQYTDTLDFLRAQLRRRGYGVMCFSGRGGELPGSDGTWRQISREETKRMFRDKKADILLCTDAAAEGLNFQFCGALVNYDMPWNPMRVEQRIGRIDRLGQDFATIQIANLHYEDTVETDVYRALRQRIGLFSRFVGKLQPILSKLPKRLAEITLAGRDDRERERHALTSELVAEVEEREADAFDIDAITDADLEQPRRPRPFYDLDDLDEVLRRPELLPPGVEMRRRLAKREYEYSMPGMSEPLRVTTDARLFDEHPGTYELWSPGSPLFPTMDVVLPPHGEPIKPLRSLL